MQSLIQESTQTYQWNWQGQPFQIAYETKGQGNPVLLLPAFSTVSTRDEMAGLVTRLATQFQTITVDFPGFGQSSRPAVEYQPELFYEFLKDFVGSTFDVPIAVIAAGHAAGYVMQLAQQQVWSRIALIAPTWRGPLPTMGAPQQVAGIVRQMVRSPLLGQALYQLNTTPAFLKLMYRRHVYTDEAKLTPDFIQQKWQITQQPGGRFAPAAFVTGALDPVLTQADFLAWFQPLPAPLLLVIGEQAPPHSKAEMEAIAALPDVQTHRLAGSLGLHEEFADEVADVVLPFLL